MSINKVDAKDGRLTLQGDYVVHHEKHITFALEGDRLPSNLKGSHSGDIFITNLRLIFVNKGSSGYRTFSMDFQSIRNTEVKQPVFGSNHIKGYIKSEPDGGWVGNANFKIDFPKGGAIEFAERFQKAVKDSLRFQQHGVAPPPPMQPTYGGYYPPPPMGAPPMGPPPMGPPPMGPPPMGPPPMAAGAYYYPPPQPGYYQYQSAPPPAGYPGQPAQPPPPYQNGAAPPHTDVHPKAQEAYMSGNTAYIPNEAPPPYNPDFSDKKQQ